MKARRILIFYSQFPPAFKSGGIVQSLANLVEILKTDFEVYVVCSAFDLNATNVLSGIVADRWNQYSQNIKVYYIQHGALTSIRSALKEINPDVVYINGLFSPTFNWLPLWLARKQGKKIVLAPRGMLQKGALSIRPIKKKVFLWLLKKLGLHIGIVWHATDSQEKRDIDGMFGVAAIARIAHDTPMPPGELTSPIRKKNVGELRMIYLSLIGEKKNLHLVLEALKNIQRPIQFDIYGPIKDKEYWCKCQTLIKDQKHNISYLEAVNPSEVRGVMAKYHVFILPTRGENFGHAIYEALCVGTPAIISSFTPWVTLQESHAGFIVDLNVDSIRPAIESFIQFDEKKFTHISNNARAVAQNFYNSINFNMEYDNLFSL